MAGHSTSTKALLYFSERVEDATEAVKGLISTRTGVAAGSGGGGGSGSASTSASARYIDLSDDVLRAQLESDRDDIRLDGLRTIIALISKGRDASGYFPNVVKLSSNQNLEIRKLVYCAVRRYARRQPDVALLGINSFQRDLQDRNAVVRMMALRVLTGLRLKVAASVVELAIAKCVRDSNYNVRRAAALSLIKCQDIVHKEDTSSLKDHVSTLLGDRHPIVLGSAVVAWKALFPTDVGLLHQHFRKLCYALGDMDEWGQREALSVLAVYAKRSLRHTTKDGKRDPDLDLFLSRTEDLLCSRNASVVTAAMHVMLCLGSVDRQSLLVQPSLRLISSKPDIAFFALINCLLLAQKNPHLLTSHVHKCLPRSSSSEAGHVTVLKFRLLVHLTCEETFDLIVAELVEHANFHPDENVASAAVMSLSELSRRGNEAQRGFCVRELLQIIKDRNTRDVVVSEALVAVKAILESSSEKDKAAIVRRLAALLFSAPSQVSDEVSHKKSKLVGKSAVHAPEARSIIYWLMGQHCRLQFGVKLEGKGDEETTRTMAEIVGLDTARLAALNFSKENAVAKLQIITLSAKLVTIIPSTSTGVECMSDLSRLHAYIMQLARFDEDYDVRDRARFCKALTDRLEGQKADVPVDDAGKAGRANGDHEHLGGVVLRRVQVEHILFEGKLPPDHTHELPQGDAAPSAWDALDFVFGHKAARSLAPALVDFEREPWADEKDLPPSSVRDPLDPPAGSTSASVASLSGGAPMQHGSLASTQKSFSSDNWAEKGLTPPTGTTSGASTPSRALRRAEAHLQPSVTSSSVSSPERGTRTPTERKGGKYRDLDDFLNAPSESESEGDEDEEDDDAYEEDVEPEALVSESDDLLEEDEEESDEESEEASDDDKDDDDGSGEGDAVKAPVRSRAVALPADEENAWA